VRRTNETPRSKVHCERIPRSLLRGMRAKWKLCFFTSLHFEDSLQLAAGSFKEAVIQIAGCFICRGNGTECSTAGLA